MCAQHLESPKNRFCEPLASIWHHFGTGRLKLDGFWMIWVRFFVESGSILMVFLNRSSVAFANNRLMHIMHQYLNSTSHFCLWCRPEPCHYFIGAAVQVHELLQETAASISLRPFVTPCSAAVRAQHLESYQNSLQNSLEKNTGNKYQFT